MPHLAAVIEAPRAPFVLKEVETAQPGSDELLVRNELIGLVPVDAKIAKYAALPVPYPYVPGLSFGGTVTAIGSAVTKFQVGDRVAVAKPTSVGNNYSPFQQFVLAKEAYTAKVPASADLHGPVGTVGNITTVIGLLSGTMGLQRPDLSRPTTRLGKKVLIYGGTSSFGTIAVQYLTQAGYDVVTTTSPKNRELTSQLGATHFIDHTQDAEIVREALLAAGPYENIVDAISLPNTVNITAAVLGAQGGGTLYTLTPPMGPENIPDNVERRFHAWPTVLEEEKNADLLKWSLGGYYQQALAENKLIHLPTMKIDGGLKGMEEACDVLDKGVSATKVVVDPWE